jgi:hypothetical protein
VSSKTHSYSKSCLFFFSRVGGGRESFACMYREGKVCAGGWGCVVNDLGKTFLSEFFFYFMRQSPSDAKITASFMYVCVGNMREERVLRLAPLILPPH